MSAKHVISTPVLDPCCGSRMFWFDKTDPRAVFGDIRAERHTLCDGRNLSIEPDAMVDFRAMQFADGQFSLVVFDPPHLIHAGDKSWLGLKYGILGQDWQSDLRQGFAECFRVLRPQGVLIFKWAEVQIKTSEILKLTPHRPLFGHQSGKRSGTHWMCFIKDGRLNPEFVEWLMGWPIGSTAFSPLAMDRCHEWWQQHGGFSKDG